MKNVLIAVLCLMIAAPQAALARLPDRWRDIELDPKNSVAPSTGEIHRQAMAETGSYPSFTVADKFLFVFDPNGYPLLVFDLTMDQLSIGEKLLGSIGIGSFSPHQLFKRYKTAKENQKDLLKAG